MCPIQSNTDQTISVCCYLCTPKNVKDLISSHRYPIRIKAAIVLYMVKLLFGRTDTKKKKKEEQLKCKGEKKRTKPPHMLMHSFKIN